MVKKVTLEEHIKILYIKELGVLVNKEPKHLIIAAAQICSGIELLGKICDTTHNLDDDNLSRKHFEDSLQNFPTLTKYSNLKDNKGKTAFYTDVRCSFSHGLMNGKYITLAPSVNNGIIITNNTGTIGIKELYNDFVSACDIVLNSTNQSIKNRLNNRMYDVF